jgi:hypothetical protein
MVLEQVVGQRLCGEWPLAYERVAQMLDRVVRASRAVECVQSVMRRHQARHRHGSPGMRELTRLYGHGRPFRYGKREGHGPDALRGLQLPTYDGWTLLRMDPKALAQQLLTQKVRV